MTADALWEEILVRRQIRLALRILALGDTDYNVETVWSYMSGFRALRPDRLFPGVGWSIHNVRMALEMPRTAL